jgi:phage baseplate assembly protein gpV
VFKWGLVEEIDTNLIRAKVKILDRKNADQKAFVSHWLPVLQIATFKNRVAWIPVKNQLVFCVFDEDFVDGAIIGAAYSKADKPPTNSPDIFIIEFDDSTKIQYDKVKKEFLIDTKLGSISLQAAIGKSGANWLIEGNLMVNGNIFAGGLLTGRQAKFDSHTHNDAHTHNVDTQTGVTISQTPSETLLPTKGT